MSITGTGSSQLAPCFHPCMSLSLKAILTLRAGMVVHELSMTEACTESSLRDVQRGLIVFPENEKTHSTSTEAAVNMIEWMNSMKHTEYAPGQLKNSLAIQAKDLGTSPESCLTFQNFSGMVQCPSDGCAR